MSLCHDLPTPKQHSFFHLRNNWSKTRNKLKNWMLVAACLSLSLDQVSCSRFPSSSLGSLGHIPRGHAWGLLHGETWKTHRVTHNAGVQSLGGLSPVRADFAGGSAGTANHWLRVPRKHRESTWDVLRCYPGTMKLPKRVWNSRSRDMRSWNVAFQHGNSVHWQNVAIWDRTLT